MNNYQFDIMERCDFMPLTAELASLPFCCGETEGDKDLEDFFHHNALLYAQERLGKTYCFVNNEGEFSEIVAFFTVSNDSVKTTFIPKPSANKVQRTIPGQKHLRTYPAVLLGRLGVNKKYQGRNFLVGQQVMNFIKTWFVQEDNKTGCRFLVVDAYNQPKVLSFYERNKFKYLYATEELEKQNSIFRKHLLFIPDLCFWIYCTPRFWNVLWLRLLLLVFSSSFINISIIENEYV